MSDPTLCAMTLSPLVNEYVRTRIASGRWSRGTAKSNRYHLNTLRDSFGKRPLDQLGPLAIDRWLESIGHLTPASRRTYLATIRGFCKWLVRERKLRRDPTDDLDKIRQPRRISRAIEREDVAYLLESVPDLRAHAVIWLMVGCGLRCIEVSRLGVGDYDPRARTIRVKGKGDHERELPVPVEVAQRLDAYLASTRSVGGPLIRSLNHPTRGIAPKTLSEMVSRWMKQAGIKKRPYDGVSAHALRHTAATDVWHTATHVDQAQRLRTVQRMLGHANLSTTSLYVGDLEGVEDLRAAMEGRDYRGRDNGTGQLAA